MALGVALGGVGEQGQQVVEIICFEFFFRKTVSPKPNLKNVRIKFKISALDQKL